MKIFIFSDLHGRIDNILEVLTTSTFDEYIFAGDFFGYFLIQQDALEIFETYQIKWILGNHDIYILRELYPRRFEKNFKYLEDRMVCSDAYEKKYGFLKATLEKLKTLNIDFWKIGVLQSKVIFDTINIQITHGSPNNSFDEYIYPDYTNFQKLYDDHDFDLLILGHTHKAFVHTYEGRVIINPGSCTLPRGDNNPSYAVFNTTTREVKIIEVTQKISFIKETRSKLKLV